jgi:heme/copper-type cytochrome/quinol oxidase subunit 3
MSGRMLSERLGKWSFWLMTIGFNMTFIIQHWLGFLGMGRRVYTYPDLPGYTWMNLLSSFGALFMTAAALILVYDVVVSLVWGKRASDNPWQAWTLEWAAPSPPPPENFHRLPLILSRRPLWDLANPGQPDPVVGSPNDKLTIPDKNKVNVVAFILSETGFFGALILAYLYFNATPRPGPNARELDLFKTAIFSACLFASSFTIWRSEVNLRREKHGAMIGWLIATIVLGTVFIVGQGIEYWDLFEKGVSVGSNLFGTTFFTLTGFHGLHVCLGLIAMLILLALAFLGDFRKPGHASVLEAFGYYWHFVDGVWVFVLTSVYILPLFMK